MRPYFFLTLAPLLWTGNFVFGKSLFLNLIPVFTPILAWPALGEHPGLDQIIGGLLVISGVTLALYGGWRRTKVEVEEEGTPLDRGMPAN
jgi:drug/metabolite transporter (DMT)-like permease